MPEMIISGKSICLLVESLREWLNIPGGQQLSIKLICRVDEAKLIIRGLWI
ncbi:hypothetical protein SS1G_11709 [Sclerotinia sclerotiorum 1980 UF-70]|uniref:Uncharacterized protein n=1 Tax=Sclerotinia sclerotiorum (strain ATCC 18683 / 1980 / Ss-1) TaxID=665079 RepID=A7F363_SCLS1|nr:hypothetical protein SS1G_11709 [Sclerotinia sclerotiorum 1980 UF-70]EDN97184.1 hypothetical protein SS1G_11709 [Sclerotinia sclerotiorum 1980 UF-70]